MNPEIRPELPPQLPEAQPTRFPEDKAIAEQAHELMEAPPVKLSEASHSAEQSPAQSETNQRVEDPDTAQEMAEAEKPVRDDLAERINVAETLGLKPEIIQALKEEAEETAGNMSEKRQAEYENAITSADTLVAQALQEGSATLYINPRENPHALHDLKKRFSGQYENENHQPKVEGLEIRTRQQLDADSKIIYQVTISYNTPEKKAA